MRRLAADQKNSTSTLLIDNEDSLFSSNEKHRRHSRLPLSGIQGVPPSAASPAQQLHYQTMPGVDHDGVPLKRVGSQGDEEGSSDQMACRESLNLRSSRSKGSATAPPRY